MRALAWCILLAAMIFAAISNRMSDDHFEKQSTSLDVKSTANAGLYP